MASAGVIQCCVAGHVARHGHVSPLFVSPPRVTLPHQLRTRMASSAKGQTSGWFADSLKVAPSSTKLQMPPANLKSHPRIWGTRTVGKPQISPPNLGYACPRQTSNLTPESRVRVP